jgi:hypothetical protein
MLRGARNIVLFNGLSCGLTELAICEIFHMMIMYIRATISLNSGTG